MSWIKYDYSGYYDNSGVYKCDRPCIEVELSKNGKSIKVIGLIDSGCPVSHASADLGKYFGENLTTLPKMQIGGVVGGSSSDGWMSNLNMQLKDFGEIFSSPIIFVDKLPVPLLLGQDNFFEKFNVKFEKHHNVFELNRIDINEKSFISILDKNTFFPPILKKSRKKVLHNSKKIYLNKNINKRTK